jgi:hypothetical protein
MICESKTPHYLGLLCRRHQQLTERIVHFLDSHIQTFRSLFPKMILLYWNADLKSQFSLLIVHNLDAVIEAVSAAKLSNSDVETPS